MTEPAVAPIDRRAAWWFWLKLGCIGFGGPAGQIAIMHRELVGRRRWISERRFLHALNYCMLLPGPEAQQLATYLGWLMHRTTGGIVAGALFVLPSLLLLIGLSWGYLVAGQSSWVMSAFAAIKPAVVVIVLFAAWKLGQRVLRQKWTLMLALAALIALGVLRWPFPWIVLTAAVIGLICARFRPEWFRGVGAHAGPLTSQTLPALIDDNTPVPEHARFRWTSLLIVLGSGLALWLLPMLALVSWFGADHAYPAMAWFFTKAALLTFGGAYAVLPYVMHGAVNQHGWLTQNQMIDGLALGETTPGPLIMIVAFVAYLGGHQAALFGTEPMQQFIAGAGAAAVVTWFTFLPSFVFILAGGPIVESTRDMKMGQAPLQAISAAVVGVIVVLAMDFGRVVFAPNGLDGDINWTAIAIAAGAAAALFWRKWSVLQVIGACALLGLALSR